ncbi:MAG TPA: hypothetical protein VFB29_09935 [Pseudolabrys sp.]|nr:hypothetical protein [Pseudolabrys sp.]
MRNAQMATDRRTPRPQLRHRRSAELLRQRMLTHSLDPDWFSLSDPVLFAKLKAICSTCKHYKRCAADLADETFDPARLGWHDYCPSSATLNLYSAVVNYYWRPEVPVSARPAADRTGSKNTAR